jgi:hypothetical protein
MRVGCSRDALIKRRFTGAWVTQDRQLSMPSAAKLPRSLAALLYHARTIYLFTASDLKTTMLPVVRIILAQLNRSFLFIIDVIRRRVRALEVAGYACPLSVLDLAASSAIQCLQSAQRPRRRLAKQALSTHTGRANLNRRCEPPALERSLWVPGHLNLWRMAPSSRQHRVSPHCIRLRRDKYVVTLDWQERRRCFGLFSP